VKRGFPPGHVTVTVTSELADLNFTEADSAGPGLDSSMLYPLAGIELVIEAWLPLHRA
jgi:hypothetical protein